MNTEPSFKDMLKHNSKIDKALITLLDIGDTSFNSCFESIIRMITEGTLDKNNIFKVVRDTNLCDLYYEYLLTHNLQFYDLQGSAWESFWSCLNHAIKVELRKPVVRDSSKLIAYVLSEWFSDEYEDKDYNNDDDDDDKNVSSGSVLKRFGVT